MDSSSSNSRSPFRAIAIRVFKFLLIVYTSILALLLMFETRLVYPIPPRAEVDNAPRGVESVHFASADGTKLHGWFLQRDSAKQVLIYFHGNGEDVDGAWPEIEELADQLEASAFVFDYRGYGFSQGNPHQKGIVADGLATIEWVSNKTGLPSDQLTFVGRSLGCGVAAQVSIKYPPRALIMLSGFSSLVDVAASHYPVFPIRWLMRNRYDSASALAKAQFPILQVHGTIDHIIPIKFGRRLFDSLSTPRKHFFEMPDRSHNNYGWPEYIDALKSFLDDIKR